MIAELPQKIEKKNTSSSSKKKSSEPMSRLVFTFSGKNYFASDFIGKPAELNKDSFIFSVRDNQKKYIVGKAKKGVIVGNIYLLSKGKDGQWWISIKDKKYKFVHIPANNVIDNNFIQKYFIKTTTEQQREFEKKLKETEKKGFFSQINKTIMLFAGLAIILLSERKN